MFLFSKKTAFGLDISDLSLKIVRFKRKGKQISFASFGEQSIEAGLIEGGEIKDDKELVKYLKKAIAAVKGDKLDTNRVICNLPEEKVFIRTIQLPKMKQEEIDQAVYWESENHIPLKIDEVYLDWQRLPSTDKNSDQIEVTIAAVPKTLVDSYFNCLKKAGLWPIAFEPESVVLARTLVKAAEASKPMMIIDLGETGTNFVILSNQVIRFTSRVPISGPILVEAIAKSLKIDQKEAQRIKIKLGLVKEKNVYKAMEPVLNDLAGRIQSSIDFYADYDNEFSDGSNSDNKISKIILCGGDSLLLGLPEYLSQKISLPVKLGNPWVNISPFIPKKAQKLGLSYKTSLIFTTAFGLALGEFK